jgi:hypothetical protein
MVSLLVHPAGASLEYRAAHKHGILVTVTYRAWPCGFRYFSNQATVRRSESIWFSRFTNP